jgi:hypothetical protein
MTETVCLMRGMDWVLRYKQPRTASGYYMYNIRKFYVMPTQCIYGFWVDRRTNSHYFPVQH